MESNSSGIGRFLKVNRAAFSCEKALVRVVYISEISRSDGKLSLDDYLGGKVPFFYRDVGKIVDSLGDGDFIIPLKETLSRLPSAKSFRDSHFCEITSSLFAEEVVGYKVIYNKLSLLTAENANAYKMDLVMYVPGSDPVEFILGEVKSSMKTIEDLPAGHDKSCFKDVFDSLNSYNVSDEMFDLAAAKDRVGSLPPSERMAVRNALKPYSSRIVRYAVFTVIDTGTRDDEEVALLGTRKNKKEFEVDLICVDELSDLAESVFKWLEDIRNVLNRGN